MAHAFYRYQSSFVYLKNYNYAPGTTINFLPGVHKVNVFLQLLNVAIRVNLFISLLILSISGCIFSFVRLWRRKAFRLSSKKPITAIENYTQLIEITILLLLLPCVFLWFYDPITSFYRSFFINLIVVIGITLFLSEVAAPQKVSTWVIYYGKFCVILAGFSLHLI